MDQRKAWNDDSKEPRSKLQVLDRRKGSVWTDNRELCSRCDVLSNPTIRINSETFIYRYLPESQSRCERLDQYRTRL